VGLPTCIDDSELYTTAAARRFAKQLSKQFSLPVHLVDERLSTVEARGRLFAEGGYRKLKNSEIDSIAACVILEQWLQHPE
jgi:putative Holliday junction resolvase